jgi:tRNA threonylcarbamoyladenosine biosynthesis protein TsaE
MELGLFEEFDKKGWHMVEWGDKNLRDFLLHAGYDIFTVTITPFEDRRKYTIKRDA